MEIYVQYLQSLLDLSVALCLQRTMIMMNMAATRVVMSAKGSNSTVLRMQSPKIGVRLRFRFRLRLMLRIRLRVRLA